VYVISLVDPKKSPNRTSTALLPPISFEDLTFDTLSDRLSDRATRRISRIVSDLHFDGLHEQVWAISTLLRFDIGIYVSDVELSSLFNHNGTWATGMIHNSNTAL
jgi:hypothetical protein